MRASSVFVFTWIVVLAAGIQGTVAQAAQTTLHFEDAPGSAYLPTDFYWPLGVTFHSGSGGEAWVWSSTVSSVLVDPAGGAFSVPNALAGNTSATGSVIAVFDHLGPGGIPGTTDYVRVGVSSGPGPDLLSNGVILLAYDAGGNLIASDPANTNLQYDYLEVAVGGIAKVTMIAGSSQDIFDDFTFNTPIPAPGAILLGAFGAGLVGWLRRRRTL